MSKTKKLMLAVLTSCSASAFAQTQVYGLVDLNVTSAKHSALKMSNYNTSRLGFKGKEDLGSGLTAIFQLEAELAADTGVVDTTAFFGRQSWVGVESALGTLRVGRTKALLDGLSDDIDPFGNNGVVGDYTTKVWRVGVAKSRISNALVYKSPRIQNMTVSASASLSELKGASDGYALAFQYKDESLNVIAAKERVVVTTAGAAQTSASTLGASYKLGDFKLLAAQNRGETNVASKGNNTGTTIGLEYELGSTTLKAVSGKLKNSKTGTTVDVIGLGAEHALSKRTQVYAHLASEDISKFQAVSLGIAHRF